MQTTLFAANGDGCAPPRVDFNQRKSNGPAAGSGGDTRTMPAGYTLPHDVAGRLKSALASYKNREAAKDLAVFLARFWSSRARLVRPFPIDRRALADREDLGLTEARIRGAIKTLEEIGFLHRGVEPPGSVHKLTPAGELHRKPILYGFGVEFGPLFAAANARAERARLRRQGRAVQGNPVVGAARASVAARTPVSTILMPETSSPKDKESLGEVVIMGEVADGSSKEPGVGRPDRSSDLEAALTRLREAWRGHAKPS